MHKGRSIFAQIMDRIPWKKFQKIIDKYQGNYHVTNLKTTVLFRVLVFAQLTRKVSLRDTIFTLNMMEPKLYHMGLWIHVKKFFGQNENAIRIQIWVAICTYLLVVIMKRELKNNVRLSRLLHFLKNVPFEEMPLNKALDENFCKNELQNSDEQPFLPGF